MVEINDWVDDPVEINDWVDDSAVKKPPTTPTELGFGDRMALNIGKRADEVNAAHEAYRRGEQGVGQTALQYFGKGMAGPVNDFIGEVVSSAVKPLSDTAVGDVARQYRDSISDSAVGDVARQYGEGYQQFATENPNAARSLESTANIIGVIPTAKGAMVVGDVASNVAKKTAKAAPLELTREVTKKASKNAYKVMEKSGTGLAPTWTDKTVDIIASAKQKPLFEGSVLTKEQKEINAALDDYLPARGKKANMDDIQGLDSTLGDKIAQAYVSGEYNKARILGDVQDRIRDSLKPENLSIEDMVSSSREGVDALMGHAIPLWSAQAQMADIEKIVKRANAMTVPATSMQTGFRNLMLNENKFLRYPPQVRKMIEKAAQTGNADDLLMVIGSRLNPIVGGSVHGLTGAAAATAYGVSKAGRMTRNALANRRANKILDALVEPHRTSIEKYYNMEFPEFSSVDVGTKKLPSPGTRLALPAPEQKMITDKAGVTRRMTPEEQAYNTDMQVNPDIKAARAAQADLPDAEVLNVAQLRRRAVSDDVWKSLSSDQKYTINTQMEKMWKDNKMPLDEMIAEARKKIQYLAAAKGEPYSASPIDQAFKDSGFAKGGSVNFHKFMAMRKRA